MSRADFFFANFEVDRETNPLAGVSGADYCLMIYAIPTFRPFFLNVSFSKDVKWRHIKIKTNAIAFRTLYTRQPSAVHPYEPTAARGHLVQNPGFMALMKDPELGKVRGIERGTQKRWWLCVVVVVLDALLAVVGVRSGRNGWGKKDSCSHRMPAATSVSCR